MSATKGTSSGISHFQRSLIVVANVIQGVGVAHRRGWTLVTTIQYNLISWNSKLENHLSNRSEQGVKPETDELTTNSSICFCSKPRHGLQNDEVDCFAAWCRGKCKEKGSLCKLVGQRLWNESRDTYIVWHCLGIAFACINLSSVKAFKKTSICTRNVWALRYTVGTAILLSLCEKVEEVFMYKKLTHVMTKSFHAMYFPSGKWHGSRWAQESLQPTGSECGPSKTVSDHRAIVGEIVLLKKDALYLSSSVVATAPLLAAVFEEEPILSGNKDILRMSFVHVNVCNCGDMDLLEADSLHRTNDSFRRDSWKNSCDT